MPLIALNMVLALIAMVCFAIVRLLTKIWKDTEVKEDEHFSLF